MASKKDVIRIADDDFESKARKIAPAGKYTFSMDKENTKVKPGTESNVLQVGLKVKKGPQKGALVFDNIAAHVGWKIVQLLLAIGMTKAKIQALSKSGKLTLPEVLKLITGKEVGAVVRVQSSEEYGKQNKIVQYLPAGADEEEDEDIEEEEDEEEEEEESEDEDDEDDEEEDDEDTEEEDEDEDVEDEEDDDEDDDEDEDEEDEDEDEDEDEEDDEEDEDDEPPLRRVVKKKPATKKVAAKKPAAKKAVVKKTTKKR